MFRSAVKTPMAVGVAVTVKVQVPSTASAVAHADVAANMLTAPAGVATVSGSVTVRGPLPTLVMVTVCVNVPLLATTPPKFRPADKPGTVRMGPASLPETMNRLVVAKATVGADARAMEKVVMPAEPGVMMCGVA